jgi:hypothetical protein
MKPAVKSYLRHVAIAVTPLLTVNDTRWQHYVFAVALAILGPLARAIDPDDHSFGVSDNDR